MVADFVAAQVPAGADGQVDRAAQSPGPHRSGRRTRNRVRLDRLARGRDARGRGLGARAMDRKAAAELNRPKSAKPSNKSGL